jgi:hypothetical protein
LAPLVLLGGAPYLAVFRPDQLQALAYEATALHAQGLNIGFAFFGLYCLTLGYLIVRSSFLPWIVGALLAVTGFAYLADSFAGLLDPSLGKQLFVFSGIAGALGEGSLTLWLLIVGVNPQRWREQARAAAQEELDALATA